ncbi:N-acetylmuramoyl-L-alanine amidase, partial [Streptomyces spectabilis]|uniref:N-acetylmuramoyl-L-alanine amidase n=1 Tax=Streptomyces spectabilis TaxID=68270 RepID=UPI0033DB07A7
MALPLSATAFRAAIEGEGVDVVGVGNWTRHNRNHKGPWGPMRGVMIHHTVTSGTVYSVALCRHGHSALPGPLCHGVIDKSGRVHLVGYGRANHAGAGDDDVLAAVTAERALPADNEANTDGNRYFYGFECINLGDGLDPWPEVQVEAIARAAAGICRKHGWGAESVIGHLEWQPGKVDPRGPIGKKGGPALTMAKIRARGGRGGGGGPPPHPHPPPPPQPPPNPPPPPPGRPGAAGPP